MLLGGGRLDGKRLLREETVRAIRTNQIGDLTIGPGQGFGLGFRVVEKVDQDDRRQLVGSYSWGGFFGTLFWIVPKEDWILVVMLQQVGGPKPPSGWPGELERLAAAAVVR
jgi:CubicO group peptidase (beta-lactamase class C family)